MVRCAGGVGIAVSAGAEGAESIAIGITGGVGLCGLGGFDNACCCPCGADRSGGGGMC